MQASLYMNHIRNLCWWCVYIVNMTDETHILYIKYVSSNFPQKGDFLLWVVVDLSAPKTNDWKAFSFQSGVMIRLDIPPQCLQPLCTLQKRAIRIINNTGYLQHTNQQFLHLHSHKLKDLVEIKKAQILYRDKWLPSNIKELFTDREEGCD